MWETPLMLLSFGETSANTVCNNKLSYICWLCKSHQEFIKWNFPDVSPPPWLSDRISEIIRILLFKIFPFSRIQLLLAYTLSTSFLNHIGRNINTYKPTKPVTGIIGINMKIIRTNAHLILAEKEPFIIDIFRVSAFW
jgi:hypothetical protein